LIILLTEALGGTALLERVAPGRRRAVACVVFFAVAAFLLM
jgi:hypothetical protein